MTKRTKQEIINSFLGILKTLNPEGTALLNLREDGRLKDMVTSQGVEIEKLEDVLESIYNDIFIDTASEEALELKLQGKGLSRLGGLPATLTMRVGSTTLPTSTINIPALFEIATEDDTPIVFRLIESGSISSSTPADGEGYYTVELEAESLEKSDRANVDTETVTDILTGIVGIDVAYNTTIGTGGREEESIDAMRRRLKAAAYNFDRGTEGWFVTETLQNFSYVKDVVVTRAVYGNGSVLISLNGYSSLTPTEISDVQDYFMDEERSDAAGWNVEVDEVDTTSVDITLTVYRSNTEVDTTMIDNYTQSYFETLGIGYDFIVNRYITYMISNITNLVDLEVTLPASSRVEIDDTNLAELGTLTISSFIESTEE
jgi:uncharacterized phage protein gp47/JayE